MFLTTEAVIVEEKEEQQPAMHLRYGRRYAGNDVKKYYKRIF
jgi:hypothetical protein